MKLMMNAALTLGTYDGSNVEISQLVGEKNIKIFGLRAQEVEDLYVISSQFEIILWPETITILS